MTTDPTAEAEAKVAQLEVIVRGWHERCRDRFDGEPTTLAWVVADLDAQLNLGVTAFSTRATVGADGAQ